VVIALDATVFAAESQRLIEQAGLPAESLQPAWWQGLLASLYGGIAEEVALRLFVMSLFAWLGHFMSRTQEGRPTSGVLWVANILAAILFGLGHLPAVLGMGVSLTTMLIVRTIVLNAVIGIIAGWLYQTRGLESAMIAHFSADIVLHVLLPLVMSLAGA
jgi:membrane protease YdiL (CAAX protease family)